MELAFNTREEQQAAIIAINAMGKIASPRDTGSKFVVKITDRDITKLVEKEEILKDSIKKFIEETVNKTAEIEVKVDKVIDYKFDSSDKKMQTVKADLAESDKKFVALKSILSTGLYDLKESFKFDRGNAAITRDLENFMKKLEKI